MSAVGTQPTETYADYTSITNIVRKRMNVQPIKTIIKAISDSQLINGHWAIQGLKADLVERLVSIFTSLKDNDMAEQYREARRLLEQTYGSRVSGGPNPTPSWRYQPTAPPHAASSSNHFSYMNPGQAAKPNPYASSPHLQYMSSSNIPSSSSMPGGHTAYQPLRRPNFQETPFLQLKEWVGNALVCPESYNAPQQRLAAVLPINLTPSNLATLKLPTAVHQLRLFCTNKTSWDSAMHPSHAAPVEFPLTCEVKVNSKPLSINLRGKKTAAKVLAPHINKDNALYFGGQENKVELVYQNTSQKYVLSVAICEVRNADSLARKIRREKLRSKEEVLGAMKKAALDDDIVMGDVAMGLKCPLSYMRLSTPIRSSICTHMQCFDALAFLSMNEQTPSWQCPHCSKTIKPDSLFLDGYVQDILDRVPESEETVLIDGEGRWHTPNKKYSSVDPATEDTPAKKEGETLTNAPIKKDDTPVNGGSLPPKQPTPSIPPRGRSSKANIEILEIDSDDEEEREEGETSPPARVNSNGNRSVDASTMGGDQPYLGTFYTSKAHSNTNSDRPFQAPASTPTPTPNTPSTLQPPPALPSLQTNGSSANTRSQVIDLTLSDSEDEGPAAVQRILVETPSNGNGNAAEGSYRHPSKTATPSAAVSGAYDGGQSTANANGHARHVAPNAVAPRPRPGHAFRTGSSSASTSRPYRRSNSQLEGMGDEEEDQDPDDSGPILPQRKRRRKLVVGTFPDEEEGEIGGNFGRSNSDELYEDERAGLTLRR